MKLANSSSTLEPKIGFDFLQEVPTAQKRFLVFSGNAVVLGSIVIDLY